MKRKGGWQFWTDIHSDHVIKTPKKPEEIAVNVKKYLKIVNKMDELDMRIERAVEDIKNSTKIIKKSNIPRRFLANIEFLGEEKIKQAKAIVLEDELNRLSKEGKENEAKKILDNAVDFLIELWKYGVHELTFKFHSNLGIINGQIVLIDPFELTDKKEKVEKQIKNRKWIKKQRLEGNPSRDLFEYFNARMTEKMTQETLDKNWRIRK